MKKILIILYCIFLVCDIYSFEFALGLGWPYISLKYEFLKKFALETKAATFEGIDVFSLRGYWNFNRYKKLKNFLGTEAGYITFDTLGLTGNGYEFGLFVGSEYFVMKNLSIFCDLSSVFISLSHRKLEVNSIEFVVNLALYWYFYSK
ncbi:MAG: hypothetical protein QXO21_01860 [Candidatus Anstonellales archaeon]